MLTSGMLQVNKIKMGGVQYVEYSVSQGLVKVSKGAKGVSLPTLCQILCRILCETSQDRTNTVVCEFSAGSIRHDSSYSFTS